MASVCYSPCFLPENENENVREEIVRLREIVITLSARIENLSPTSFEDLISHIEYGLNGIIIGIPQLNVSGEAVDSLDILKSCIEFGRDLVKCVPSNTRSCKVCSFEKLGYDASKVVSAVVNEAPNMRWMAAGLCVVAYVVAYVTDEMKKDSAEKSVYVQHLLYMLGLLKYILLKYIRQQNELQPKMLKDVVNFILLGSLLCGFLRFSTSTNKGHMDNLEFRLAYAYPELAMSSVLEDLPSTVPGKLSEDLPSTGQKKVLEEIPQSQEPQIVNVDAVGIEKARDDLISLLEADRYNANKKGVVIHGPDGIGKTTIANAVFDRLQQRLSNYEFYRVEIKPRSSNHDIKILQQQLLRDFSGENIVLCGCMEGAAHLSNAFRIASRPVLIFIDNVQRKSDLESLLLSSWDNLSMGSKILITSTQPLELGYLSDHSMRGLDDLEAKNLLSREFLGNAEASIRLKLNLDNLTTRCKGIPLALTLAASYVRQNGDHLSTSMHLLEYLVKIQRAELDVCGSIVDFIYSRLEEPYKEAFLDIAIFFKDWERHKVVHTFPDIQVGLA